MKLHQLTQDELHQCIACFDPFQSPKFALVSITDERALWWVER